MFALWILVLRSTNSLVISAAFFNVSVILYFLVLPCWIELWIWAIEYNFTISFAILFFSLRAFLIFILIYFKCINSFYSEHCSCCCFVHCRYLLNSLT